MDRLPVDAEGESGRAVESTTASQRARQTDSGDGAAVVASRHTNTMALTRDDTIDSGHFCTMQQMH